jgi:hypothetical protein
MAGPLVSRWILIAFIAMALFAVPVQALQVEQTLWGFDGHVVPDRFNPLSVLVSNPGNLAFDGTLTLSPEVGGTGAHGASYVQPIFLAPHTSRWVQFYVQTGGGGGRYGLSWGRGAHDSYDLEEHASNGPPARVWLRDLENPFTAGGSLKSFPDQLFPTSAPAAEGLDAVVLDHVPNWESARREAFLDWVKLGGTVHLLPGADGSLPVFGEDLRELDTKDAVARIGAGRIVHHAVAPREMSAKYLAEHGYPARIVENTKNPSIYDLEGTLFRDLSSLTRPKVNWVFIDLLMVAYVAVIGPIHNYYRRRLDYRISILVFLGCVALFGVALGISGRRGYGESQTVHSLAIARSLGGGRADVTQWVTAFATSGDRYVLTHRAPANLYAPDRWAEVDSGLFFNGKDGRVLLDIPLYSARAFMHRAIMTGDDTSVTVEKWEINGSPVDQLRLRVGSGFPQHPSSIQAVFRGSIYKLVLREGLLELDHQGGKLLADYFAHDKLSPAAYSNISVTNAPQTADGLRELMPVLAARALHYPGVFPNSISAPKNSADLQLLIVAPAPPSFQLQGKGFAHEDGCVLYVQDVYKP